MSTTRVLDLSSLPPIFVLPSSLDSTTLHDVEDLILESRGKLTYNASEACIFLAKILQKKRAAFELRSRGVWTDETRADILEPTQKRRKLDHNLKDEKSLQEDAPIHSPKSITSSTGVTTLDKQVVVLKLDWLHKSLDAGAALSYHSFIIYRGRLTEPDLEAKETKLDPNVAVVAQSIAKINATIPSMNKVVKLPPQETNAPSFASRFPQRRFKDQNTRKSASLFSQLQTHPRLQHSTTSDHDLAEPHNLPPPPAWLTGPHPQYSCLRSTYPNPPNQVFLAQLYKIKEARLLTLDEIGVRAYSTAIASVSAMDREITNASEITRLPGCSDKIAMLWIEWFDSSPDPSQRCLSVTTELDNDPDLKILRSFWNIYGVGPETARKLYFDKGWKDLDDIVEFGWNSALSRVQQIGIKFYDDFLLKIPRQEVEATADVVLHHARLAAKIPPKHWSNIDNSYRGNWSKPDDGKRDPAWNANDICAVIVGGYRRGKTECGDVDVILSHRNNDKTQDLVIDVVRRLEDAGYITHTLSLHTTNSERDQQTLPYRGRKHGHGFDTLDKALCVWQHPEYPGKADGNKQNPNPHRRVDIIVSPWRTVGAAVLGWSGATTFERDIRQWCSKERGWKFDSSGVRDRGTGEVLDLESPPAKEKNVDAKGKRRQAENEEDEETADEADADSDDGQTSSHARTTGHSKEMTQDTHVTEASVEGWQDRERRLMENLGIGWRPACERCTG